eukprot:264770-Chlamydomonas_euryale.AAC.7
MCGVRLVAQCGEGASATRPHTHKSMGRAVAAAAAAVRSPCWSWLRPRMGGQHMCVWMCVRCAGARSAACRSADGVRRRAAEAAGTCGVSARYGKCGGCGWMAYLPSKRGGTAGCAGNGRMRRPAPWAPN